MSRHAVVLMIKSVSHNKTAVIRNEFHVMCVRYIYYTWCNIEPLHWNCNDKRKIYIVSRPIFFFISLLHSEWFLLVDNLCLWNGNINADDGLTIYLCFCFVCLFVCLFLFCFVFCWFWHSLCYLLVYFLCLWNGHIILDIGLTTDVIVIALLAQFMCLWLFIAYIY